MKNKKELAFPINIGNAYHTGMTLRDYFAAKALQGILSSDVQKSNGEDNLKQLSIKSYQFADAMLTEREKTQSL